MAPGSAIEVYEAGPHRFAARYSKGPMNQLRVVEWDGERSAHGVIDHTVSGRPYLTARYELALTPSANGTTVGASYVLETPLWGLAWSLRWSRPRSLARRVARSWLRLENERQWAAAKVERVERGGDA